MAAWAGDSGSFLGRFWDTAGGGGDADRRATEAHLFAVTLVGGGVNTVGLSAVALRECVVRGGADGSTSSVWHLQFATS